MKQWQTGNNVAIVVDEKYLCDSSSNEFPRQVLILRACVQKGASQFHDDSLIVSPRNQIRPATEKDFEDFRVSTFGYF